MKALFNGTCERCGTFKPRCARVYRKEKGGLDGFRPSSSVLCEDCRKFLKGAYRLHEQHK